MNQTKIQDDILYTKNGEVQNPIDLNIFLIATKFFFSFFGIPLNVFLATIIVRLRRLYSKPRNIFLLGIFFSNLLIFIPPVIELLYWIHPELIMCQVYVCVVPLPYAILLLNILSAQIDRYVAITYPVWHKRKVTVTGVSCYLFVSSAALILLIKFVFIFEILPLRCEIRVLHGQISGGTLVILFISCFILHLILYQRTRKILKASQLAESTETTRATTDVQPDATIKTENIVVDAAKSHSSTNPASTMFQVANGNLSQMEMEATRALLTGIFSLFVLATPPIVFFLAFLICSLMTESECSSFSWLAPYIKEFGLVHAVYNPIIYVFRNKELWSVLRSKFKSLNTANNP